MNYTFKTNTIINKVTEKTDKAFEKASEALEHAGEAISAAFGEGLSGDCSTVQDNHVTVILKEGEVELRGKPKAIKLNGKKLKF